MSEKTIVACPNCQTRFIAPLEKFLPKGRKVRCAKCGNSWFHSVEAAGAAAQHPPATPSAPHSTAQQPTATTSSVPTAASPPPSEKPPLKPEEPLQHPSVPRARSSESIMDRAAQRVSTTPETQVHSEPEQLQTTDVENSTSTAAAIAGAATVASAAGAGIAETAKADTKTEPVPEMPEGARSALPEPSRRGRFPRILFYTIAAALIAGALGYFFKDQIVAKVPALNPGLTSWKNNIDDIVSKVIQSDRSISIQNVKYDIEEAEGEKALLVTAEVVNQGNAAQKAPALIVTTYGNNDAVLDKINFPPEDASSEIAVGGRESYFLSIPNPQANLNRVEVDFAE